MSLEENSLWNSRVLNARLNDVNGIVVKVEEDSALPDSKVLAWVLDNWLLEVSFKVEHLKVVTVRVSYQI